MPNSSGTNIEAILIPIVRAKIDDEYLDQSGNNNPLYENSLLIPKIAQAAMEVETRWPVGRTLQNDDGEPVFANSATTIYPLLNPTSISDNQFVIMLCDITKLYCRRLFPDFSQGTRDLSPSALSRTVPRWRSMQSDSQIIDTVVEKWRDQNDPTVFKIYYGETVMTQSNPWLPGKRMPEHGIIHMITIRVIR
jgi:hypothetical protein